MTGVQGGRAFRGLMAVVAAGWLMATPAAAQTAGQAGAGTATPKPVIGVLDQQRVLAESTAARAVTTQKDKYQDAYQGETAEQEKRLRSLDEQLANQRATLSPEAFSAKREDFQKQVTDFQKQVQNRRRNLERAYGQAMTEIQNSAVRITDQVAAERGMNIIVYRSQVFLFDPKMDITEDVLARLNRQLPSVTMANPDKLPAQGDKPAAKAKGAQ